MGTAGPPVSNDLDGEWTLRRTGGLLPPLIGVRKVIAGDRGATYVGPFPAAAFRVEGLALRYLAPFMGFVDVLEPDGEAFAGRATFRGREFGRFAMTRSAGHCAQTRRFFRPPDG
jgi:hypothetical protein